MKSKSLKHRYYEFELGIINWFFPFKNGAMPKVSLLPLKLLIQGIEKYFNEDVNLSQNTNLYMRAIGPDIVKATLILERLVKNCKKTIFDEKDRYVIKLESVVTYVFFTDEAGNILNVQDYVTRIKEALVFLIDFFEKNRNTEGTQAYAICKTIYMHLEYMYTFVGDLTHVFLGKSIK